VNEEKAAKATKLETPLLEAQRAAGAEFAEYFGVRLPARFRDPLVEYEAARSGVALIDTNFRSVFALSGPDRVRYLNAVTSGNIRDLAPGTSVMLVDGAEAEIVTNPGDGVWLFARYLSSPRDPTLIGQEEMIFAQDIVGLGRATAEPAIVGTRPKTQ